MLPFFVSTSSENSVAEVVAPQAATCLGAGPLLGQAALDILEVVLALTGLPLGGIDAPVGGRVVQLGARNLHIHGDLVAEAQMLVDVGGCHLAGGNGPDGGSRAGDAVAAGEHAVHIRTCPDRPATKAPR